MKRKISMFVVIAAVAALGGCEDPAKDKPKASVGSAKPTPATSASGATTAAAATASSDAAGAEYTINQDSSKLEFVGSKVTGKHDGGFKAFTGSAKTKDGAIEGGSVEVEIDATSVFSDDDKLTGHLKTKDFFDVENHPKAKFVSTEIKKGGEGGASHTVTGNLTLRGETKSVTFPATITTEGDSAKVKAEFSINRKDFGLQYAGKPDDLIRDDVVIKLDLDLKKKS
jgi:polyisoprenoid-binding protein YceI